MQFWIPAIALLALVVAGMVLPLVRKHRRDLSREGQLAALKAELAEIEADRGERFASEAEADAARAEVARRLFALEREQAEQPTESTAAPSWALALLILPLLSVPTYFWLGSHGYSDQPILARMQPEQPAGDSIEALVARVEKQLRANPEDSMGWQVLAPVYVRLGRMDDAEAAWANAARYAAGPASEKSAFMANQAEIAIMRANGQVPPVAKTILDEAITLDPENQKALFFLAIAMEQAGPEDAAKANWQALVDRFSAANPPWLDIARQRLGIAPASGPSAADVAAAQDMSADDRNAMIEGMVARLAERLKSEPADIDGWLRLIRAYTVLGKADDAKAALAEAGRAFAEGTPQRGQLDALARELSLSEG